MRLAAYLCTSRHGIFYFRFPVPVECHPAQKRGHIKVALATREPKEARDFARRLVVAGQAAMAQPIVRAMPYEDMRNHVRDPFSEMLKKFRDRTANEGPADEMRLGALKTAQTLAQANDADWLELTQHEDAQALLRAFCEARGIAEVPDGREAKLLLAELHKWPALIGIFTGMRLNEVAQLEVHDIELQGEVWCINVTPDGDDHKRLKNASSSDWPHTQHESRTDFACVRALCGDWGIETDNVAVAKLYGIHT